MTDEQWTHGGHNSPQQLNDEDKHRTVGVIAHHVAISMDGIMGQVQASVEGRPRLSASSGTLRQAVQAVNFENAQHAVEHVSVTKEEVLQLLQEQKPRFVAALRAIADDQFDPGGGLLSEVGVVSRAATDRQTLASLQAPPRKIRYVIYKRKRAWFKC